MKKILIFITCNLLFSCSDDDLKECADVSGQDWYIDLKAELDEDCSIQISIFKGNYREETVYYQLITDPRVNFQAMLQFYSCEGDLVAELSANESNNYLNEPGRMDEKIYTCSEQEI